MQDDYLDILDKKGKKTGKVKTYTEVHQKGLIHRSIHVWFINSKKEILIQKRSKKVDYGGFWDISVAGHIVSQQTSLQTALKETQEELGIKLKKEEIKLLKKIKEILINKEKKFFNKEFVDLYVIHKNLTIKKIKKEEKEIEEMRWLSLEEFEKWTNGKGEKMVPHKEEYKIIINYVKNI